MFYLSVTYLVIFLAGVLISLILMHRKLSNLECGINNCINEIKKYEDEIDDTYESMVEQRESEFDARIKRIKEELSIGVEKQNITEGTPAQELHPLVHNLPHDSIRMLEVYPDVEVAD